MTALGTIPPAPTNLVATATSSTHITLTWTATPGADMYIIYRGSAAGNETFYTSAPNSTTFSGDHLTPGQTTSWEVRAVRAGLISNFSNEQVVTTLGAPSAPSGITAVATSTSQIDLTWSAVTNAKAYYIYISVGGGPYTVFGAVLSPSLTFTAGGLTTMTAYSFVMTTLDQDNTESAQSAPVSATTM
jgi:fibronectin type 3 domain-containing protein